MVIRVTMTIGDGKTAQTETRLVVLGPTILISSPINKDNISQKNTKHYHLCELFCYGIPGHIVLDEDLERTVLVVNLGVIPPLETVNVLVSTSSELPTLPNGGIRVTSPTVCTPRVQRTINEEQGLSPNFHNRA